MDRPNILMGISEPVPKIQNFRDEDAAAVVAISRAVALGLHMVAICGTNIIIGLQWAT